MPLSLTTPSTAPVLLISLISTLDSPVYQHETNLEVDNFVSKETLLEETYNAPSPGAFSF